MVGLWFPDQLGDHAINGAHNSETGQSIGFIDHFKYRRVEGIHF
jgi:hypothetical protein